MNINKELHRSINTDTSFDKYFENSSCKPTFEKNGNTTETMRVMKKNALRDFYQTKEIATYLQGKTIEETVNNIYNFLYNNVQYKIDGYKQNLRSPNCTWVTRTEGIDCKSYSVFASTILLNLGIPHAFRKVKQLYYEPTEWTHVYVVVKTKGKQLVIDPTIHINNEVEYVEKKDIKMESKLPIYSLNAGSVATQTNPRHIEIRQGFEEVLTFLRKIGVSETTINQVNNSTENAYMRKGSFDFTFKLSQNNILNIDGKRINLLPNGLNAGLNDGHIPVYTPTIDESIFDVIINDPTTIDPPTGNTSGTGILGLLDPSGGFLSGLLSGLLDDFDLMGNISNVFEFGLDSWGASTNPSDSLNKFNTEAVPYVQSVLQGITGSNVSQKITEANKYLTFLIALENHKLRDHTNASSTRAGRNVIIDEATKLRQQVIIDTISNLQSNGAVINTTTSRGGSNDYQWSPTDNSFHGDGGYDYKTYTISVSQQYIDNAGGSDADEGNSLLKVIGVGAAAFIAKLAFFS